jgi:hypothetical protein
MKTRRPTTYENEALSVLAYEFPFSDRAEAERKIKQRLSRKKLGRYDAARIDLLRQLKDVLQQEISKFEKSQFFTEFHGKYSDMRDFDVPRLTAEMMEHFPQIPKEEIEQFVPFCVFIYYLR